MFWYFDDILKIMNNIYYKNPQEFIIHLQQLVSQMCSQHNQYTTD